MSKFIQITFSIYHFFFNQTRRYFNLGKLKSLLSLTFLYPSPLSISHLFILQPNKALESLYFVVK